MAKTTAGKRSVEPKIQVGAIPFRRRADGAVEIMLVTTRETQRWIVPKGWPIRGLKSHEAAAREALEEAGLIGEIGKKPVGRYTYWKRKVDHFVLCKVRLYLLEVKQQLPTWPEQTQRRCLWFTQADAADLIDEPALGAIVAALDIKGS
ncbi:NUDIX hydrolase [Bosea sp. (in: a-proteobacteria)]|uniref:NUDIX hydrolase n=1 Tax=Bosea sp. (in: a-proteobacteria) TaxID=1871050 RepID=UPI002FC60534